MRIKKRAGMGRTWLLTVLAAVLFMTAIPVTAHAAPMPSSGTLTIHADAGAEFSVWQVDPAHAGSVSTAAEARDYLVDATKQTVTTGTGTAVMLTLAGALYYVEDTGSGRYQSFLAHVPYEDSSGVWQTDVSAYPKDRQAETFVIDQFVGEPGDTDYDFASYNVSKEKPVAVGELFGVTTLASIPQNIGSTSGESYKLTGSLDSHYEYPGGSLKVYTVPDMKTPVASANLLSDAYYSLTYDPVTGVPISVVINNAGISQLSARVRAGDQYLMVKFDCRLIKTAPAGVSLYGGATVEYAQNAQSASARSGSGGSGLALLSASVNTASATASALPLANTNAAASAQVTDQPAVHTGKIGITKLADGTDKPLSGAEFGIAATKADAQAENFIATGTTGTDGELVFKGLKYGLPGDLPNENTGNTTFWLAEIKAPDGYKIMKDPVEITFNYQQDEDGRYYFARVTVYNAASDASGDTGLKTGDSSNIYIYLGLMALSAAGITGLALYMKKKRAANREQ